MNPQRCLFGPLLVLLGASLFAAPAAAGEADGSAAGPPQATAAKPDQEPAAPSGTSGCATPRSPTYQVGGGRGHAPGLPQVGVGAPCGEGGGSGCARGASAAVPVAVAEAGQGEGASVLRRQGESGRSVEGGGAVLGRLFSLEPAQQVGSDGDRPELEALRALGYLDQSEASDQRGYIGIELSPGSDGIVVRRVLEGSPAARIGLQPGDRITRVGEHELPSGGGAMEVLQALRAGQAVELRIVRGEHVLEETIELAPAAGLGIGGRSDGERSMLRVRPEGAAPPPPEPADEGEARTQVRTFTFPGGEGRIVIRTEGGEVVIPRLELRRGDGEDAQELQLELDDEQGDARVFRFRGEAGEEGAWTWRSEGDAPRPPLLQREGERLEPFRQDGEAGRGRLELRREATPGEEDPGARPRTLAREAERLRELGARLRSAPQLEELRGELDVLRGEVRGLRALRDELSRISELRARLEELVRTLEERRDR